MAEVDGEPALQPGEVLQVGGRHARGDLVLLCRVDEGHAAALEAGAGEAAAVDAVGFAHDFVQADGLGRAGLPVVDAAPAGLEGEAAVSLEVALAPGFGPGLHAPELGVPVLAAPSPGGGEPVFVLAVDLIGHPARVGFVELAVVHAGEGLQGVDAGAELVHAHVVLGGGEAALEAAEEDGEDIGLHVRAGGDELEGAVPGVQVEQVVLSAEDFAALVQGADVDADVVFLRVEGGVDELAVRERDAVDAAEGGEKGEDHGGGGGETPDGERALDDAADAGVQHVATAERPGGAAKVVRPVAGLLLRDGGDVPLRALGKLQRLHLYNAVALGAPGDVDALVDGKAGDLAEVVVGVGADRADAVGAEAYAVRIAAVGFEEFLFTEHGGIFLLFGSVAAEEVAGVDLVFDVVQDGVVAVGDDAAAHFFELLQVVDDFGAEEGGAVFERGLVDDDGGALGLNALHDALDGGLAEVVRVGLHGEAVDADDDFLLLLLALGVIGGVAAVGAGDLQHAVGDEVLAGAVGLDNGLDQVLGHVAVVGEELLGVLREAVAAVAEGGVVVVVADARVEADAADDLPRAQTLDLGVGVQLVEVGDAQGEVGVDEELGGLRLGEAHEEGLDVRLEGAFLQEGGEGAGLVLGVRVAADDDAGGVEVVVEGLGLAQELGAEENVGAVLFAHGDGVADGDGGLNDDGGRGFAGAVADQGQDALDGGAVEVVGLGVVVGGHGHDDEVRSAVCGSTVGGGGEVKRTCAGLSLCKIPVDILVLDGGDIPIEVVCLLLFCADRGHMMMLGQ